MILFYLHVGSKTEVNQKGRRDSFKEGIIYDDSTAPYFKRHPEECGIQNRRTLHPEDD
jgi:hypothetical protein